MDKLTFTARWVAVLKERWSEPFVGAAIGALCAFLVGFGWPIARPLLNAFMNKVQTELSGAATWPDRGNLVVIVALGAVLVLALRPGWRVANRVMRSWAVGLVSGIVLIWIAATFLWLAVPSNSRLFPYFYLGPALAYTLLTIFVSGYNRVDIDRSAVMRRLKLPRDQIQQKRLMVVEDEVFTSVLENPNPITQWKHDWIGRAPFVEGVLQRVIIHEEPVVAITGAFGAGKSSILYLIKEALTPCSEIVSVPFTSFLPGDEQTLVASLLGSITRAVRERFIVPGMRRDFVRYGRTVAGVIPKMGDSLKDFFERPSQAEEVAELKNLLSRLPVRVVVLLDEIDRLQQDELLVLLKLLRGVADLPRLRYICAFNKNAVARTVSERPKEGYDYLEKFFPVELAIPKIDDEALRDLFRIRLNALRTRYSRDASEDAQWVAEQCELLWLSAGKRHFSTLRRLSTYFKNLEAVSQAIGKEVNFFDLSVLEAVRQLDPSVFEFIYGHGYLFYFPSWRLSLWPERISVNDEEERKAINAALDEFCESIDPTTREVALQLLSRIFPNVAAYHKPDGVNLGPPTRDSSEADRLKRIYHPAYFHRYFIYEVPASLYGERELANFVERVNEASDKEALTEVLRKEISVLDNIPLRRADFFDRLPEGSKKAKPEKAELLVYCVAEICSSLEPDILGMGEQGRARALVFAVANRFIATSKAQEILETVIRNAASDGFAADILFYCINQDRNNIIHDWKNIDTVKLQSAFCERMNAKYAPDVDRPVPRDLGSLTAFFTWSKISEHEQKGIIAYLRSRFDKGAAELAAFIAWLFPGEVAYDSNPGALVDRLFPVTELQARTANLEQQVELTETQRAALDRFRALCAPAAPPASSETEQANESATVRV